VMSAKITFVETYVLKIPVKIRLSTGEVGETSHLITEVHTDCGVMGIGERTSYAFARENVSVANLCLAGFYNTTLTAQDATIYLSGDELPLIEISLNSLKIYVDKSAINLTIQEKWSGKKPNCN